MITSARIKELATEVGFDLCGITSPDVIPEARQKYYEWLRNKYHGAMAYMAKEPERRSNPREVMPEARAIIMLGVNYNQENSYDVPRGFGLVSRYARGRDYHKYIEKLSKQLIGRIKAEVENTTDRNFRYYVDYGPMLERAYAEKAGLGYIGKNSMLINKRFGSWIFLAEIITSLDLESDQTWSGAHGRCGTCRRCLDICPTGAIVDEGVIDARRCISYLTIESPKDITPELADKMESLVFGCDLCQDVCPHNLKAIPTTHEELTSSHGAGTLLNIEEILAIDSDEAFTEKFAGTPVKRPGREGLKINARVVRDNQAKSKADNE